MKTLNKLKPKVRGQLVSNEVTIGQNVLSIRALKSLIFRRMSYAIYVQNGERYFIHSRTNDLQNSMADFTKLVADYRKMITVNK